MKQLLITILILCWPLTAHAWVAKVISITDGDTINVYNTDHGQVNIRFYGIDSPEKGQPYGQAAGKYLASLIAGAIVDIESIAEDPDGWTVGIVSDGERNINQEMIKAGYAWVYRWYCNKPFCEDWLALENEARTKKIGLWQDQNPIPPWLWSRRN